MKEKSLRIMDEVPPTFFSKLGEALKLIEEYRQHLEVDSKRIELEKKVPSTSTMREKK